MSVEGDIGPETAGVTLDPRWLVVRGLEIEREVKVYAIRSEIGGDPGGVEFMDARFGALDFWLSRLQPGEPVLVFDDDTCEVIAKAELTADRRLQLDRELPERLFASSTALILTRVRGIPSCALDEIKRHGKMSNQQIGHAIARHRTLVAREVKGALRKAIDVGAEMGVEPVDLMRALMSMGEK